MDKPAIMVDLGIEPDTQEQAIVKANDRALAEALDRQAQRIVHVFERAKRRQATIIHKFIAPLFALMGDKQKRLYRYLSWTDPDTGQAQFFKSFEEWVYATFYYAPRMAYLLKFIHNSTSFLTLEEKLQNGVQINDLAWIGRYVRGQQEKVRRAVPDEHGNLPRPPLGPDGRMTEETRQVWATFLASTDRNKYTVLMQPYFSALPDASGKQQQVIPADVPFRILVDSTLEHYRRYVGKAEVGTREMLEMAMVSLRLEMAQTDLQTLAALREEIWREILSKKMAEDRIAKDRK